MRKVKEEDTGFATLLISMCNKGRWRELNGGMVEKLSHKMKKRGRSNKIVTVNEG